VNVSGTIRSYVAVACVRGSRLCCSCTLCGTRVTIFWLAVV
jgi:hypothetical protein